MSMKQAMSVAVVAASLLMVQFAAGQDSTAGAAAGAPATGPAPSTLTERISYGLGVNMGQQIKQEKLDLDPQWLAAGLNDVLKDQPLAMTEAQIEQAFEEVRGQVMAERSREAQTNLEKSQKFLEENAKQAEVKTLPSGLQYQVLKEGTGPKPAASDTVRVSYTGKLVDGTVFDSSQKHGGSVEFQVDQVIAGWTQALQMMGVGSQWRLFIPPDLAYGERGAGPVIGPNQALIFEVELLGISSGSTQPSEDAAPVLEQ